MTDPNTHAVPDDPNATAVAHEVPPAVPPHPPAGQQATSDATTAPAHGAEQPPSTTDPKTPATSGGAGGGGAGGSAPTPSPPPKFPLFFAVLTFVIAAAATGFVLRTVGGKDLGYTTDELGKFPAGVQVAVRSTSPSVLFGVVLIGFGLWLASVEWRSGFAQKQEKLRLTSAEKEIINKIIRAVKELATRAEHRDLVAPLTEAAAATAAAEDATTSGASSASSTVSSVVDSLGKLRGAPLVLLTGVVLLLSSTWVGQSSAGGPAANPTPTATVTATPPAG